MEVNLPTKAVHCASSRRSTWVGLGVGVRVRVRVRVRGRVRA